MPLMRMMSCPRAWIKAEIQTDRLGQSVAVTSRTWASMGLCWLGAISSGRAVGSTGPRETLTPKTAAVTSAPGARSRTEARRRSSGAASARSVFVRMILSAAPTWARASGSEAIRAGPSKASTSTMISESVTCRARIGSDPIMAEMRAGSASPEVSRTILAGPRPELRASHSACKVKVSRSSASQQAQPPARTVIPMARLRTWSSTDSSAASFTIRWASARKPLCN